MCNPERENFIPPPPQNDKKMLKHNQTYMSGSFMLCAVRKKHKGSRNFHHFPPSFPTFRGGKMFNGDVEHERKLANWKI